MKKLVNLICLFALALIVVTPAFAEDATRSGKVNRTEFRTKLDSIRDEKKKAIVDRIDKRIPEINANRTSIMLSHLTKIEEILNRLETRTNDLATAGKDVTAIRTAITNARDAITSARSAVTAQAAKTYTFNITTEGNLGQVVSATRLQFARDLQATHKAVVAVRKAVRDVLTALSKITGEKLPESPEK